LDLLYCLENLSYSASIGLILLAGLEVSLGGHGPMAVSLMIS
jgi:hypothetical protein